MKYTAIIEFNDGVCQSTHREEFESDQELARSVNYSCRTG